MNIAQIPGEKLTFVKLTTFNGVEELVGKYASAIAFANEINSSTSETEELWQMLEICLENGKYRLPEPFKGHWEGQYVGNIANDAKIFKNPHKRVWGETGYIYRPV